jgi:predicted transcriptional regulator
MHVTDDPPIPVRYVILLELVKRGPLRASEMVDETGLTLQGVSYNLDQLAEDDLVAFEGENSKAARITNEGVEALHGHFVGLKAFVDLALEEMMHVETCVAIAETDLEPGDEVGLFMQEGRLVARREASSSEGRVRKGAEAGDIVTVTDLTGVVDLDPGTIHLVRLPPPVSLPDAKTLAGFVDEHVPAFEEVACSGLEADLFVDRAGLAADRDPIPYAPGEVALAAARSGLDVLLVAAWEDARQLEQTIDRETSADGEPTLTTHRVPSPD